MSNQLLSIGEAAARIGISPHTLRAMIRSKAIACYRVGPRRGGIRLSVEDLDRYLMAGRVEAGHAPTEEPRCPVSRLAARAGYPLLGLGKPPSRGRRAAR